MFEAFKHRNFVYAWIGQAVSALGDSAYQLTLNWIVASLFGTAKVMALVQLFTAVPTAISRPFAGKFIDKWGKKRALILSNCMMFILMSMFSIILSHGVRLTDLLIFVSLFGIFSSTIEPAFFAYVPELTANKDLESANSLIMFLYSITGIIGPILAAFSMLVLGKLSSVWFNSATFLIAAIFTCFVAIRSVNNLRQKQSSASFVEALTWILRNNWATRIYVTESLANLLLGLFWALFPVELYNYSNSDILNFGSAYTMIYLGATIATIISGFLLKKLNDRGAIAYLSIVLLSSSILGLGYSSLMLTYILAFILGVSLPWFNIVSHQSLQEGAPREMLGRITAFGSLLTTVTRLLAFLLIIIFNKPQLSIHITAITLSIMAITFIFTRSRSTQPERVSASL
ncbi:MFS transporter [Alicyclobacillus shizuokensis]|uniref:MFS transporter n=1 Tax=Alicyclobacillus shizuokensis TaxID=392014 RepID=UPI0008320C1E|nr:MFS transporter [Alicyclobacillus shizuokensis]